MLVRHQKLVRAVQKKEGVGNKRVTPGLCLVCVYLLEARLLSHNPSDGRTEKGLTQPTKFNDNKPSYEGQ